MIEKFFVEIQGAFLVKICDNTFNGTSRENAFEHINNFLKVVGPLKINGVSQDRFRFSIFPISLTSAASEWFKNDCIGSVTTWENLVEKFVQKFYQLSDDNEEMEAEERDDPDDIAEIFKIKGNLFNYETPLCKAFNDFNYPLKTNTGMFTFDIQGIRTYEENYEVDNVGHTQDNQEHEKEHRDPSTCRVRRFEMIKYSFDDDDEYVAIKEHEYSEYSETNIDTCQAYRELFRIMDEGWLVTKAYDE
nr:hypothetical protein [Tanacetum cinerariifolium]